MSSDPRMRVGEVRSGQVLHTYGIGALVDLPQASVMVQGIEAWPAPKPEQEIQEDRLLGLVRSHLGQSVDRLALPPIPDAARTGRMDPQSAEAKVGVPVTTFPRWVRCPRCELLAPLDYGVFKLEHNPYRPDRTRFVHENCPGRGKPPAVLPARFLLACDNGHVDDFPWHYYVHQGVSQCPGPLDLREPGISTEVADVFVHCRRCDVSRPLTKAFGEDAKDHLPGCPGRHPHLGRDFQEPCQRQPKAMLAGASNIWFAISVSAISLPSGLGRLDALVRDRWPTFRLATSIDILKFMRARGELQDFAQWADDEVWRAIARRRTESGAETAPQSSEDLKLAEWELLSRPGAAPVDADFRLVEVNLPPGYEGLLERVVQVQRMRVVKALTGFTRIVSPGDFTDIGEIPAENRGPLGSGDPGWVPATEVRGEGIFLMFRRDALARWASHPALAPREQAFRDAHRRFREARRIAPPDGGFPGMAYVLLHTLSHALVRQFSVECGYAAASLSERLYVDPLDADPRGMAGLLLYTAAADSEGTLGGLVALAEPATLSRHLDCALERASLCASDPLCSEHAPESDGRTLHGAACHACGFVSETTCERGNKYLDRSLLVGTLGGTAPPYFPSAVSA